jgi:hypothetical protein
MILVAVVVSVAPGAIEAQETNPHARGTDPTWSSIASPTGPFAVTTTAIADADTPGFGSATVSYPTTTTQGTFGAVAVSPGFTSPESAIAWWGPLLASHGFVVITYNTLDPNDQPPARTTQLLAALDFLVSPASPVDERVDPTRLAVMGHSMGGGGALGATAARPSLRASVPLTPWHTQTQWTAVTTPTLVIGARNDVIAAPAHHAVPFYESMPFDTPKAYAELRGAGHMTPTAFDPTLASLAVSWLKRFVDDDTRYDQFLCPASIDTVLYSQYRSNCPYTPLADPSVPHAPVGLVVVPGDRTADLSWAAPSAHGGTPLIGYRVQVTTDPGGVLGWSEASGSCAAAVTGRDLATSCRATNLSNGTTYRFRVTALNAGGLGVDSAAVVVVPRTVPGAPGVASGVALDAAVAVSWSAPVTTGGSPVTEYTVAASPGSQTCSVAPPLTTCTVSGLSNGSAYRFSVTATNAAGTGAPSPLSAAVTPRTVPSAVAAPVVTPRDGGLSATWSPPSDTGGVPLDSYVVESRVVGSVDWVAVATAGLETSVTIESLTNGLAHEVRVAAVNVAGVGAFSIPSSPATPLGLPSAPGRPDAFGVDGGLSLSWAGPEDDGGAPVTSFVVQVRVADTSVWTVSDVSPDGPAVDLTGLTRGVAHEVRVAAVNEVGVGSFSLPSEPVVPVGPPGVGPRASVVPGDGRLTVSWPSVLDDGGRPVTRYSVELSSTGATSWRTVASTTARTVTLTGLVNGQSYRVRVIARNEHGDGPPGPASPASVPRTVPDAPARPEASPRRGRVVLTWVPGTWNGGSSVTDFVIRMRCGTGRWTTVNDPVSSAARARVGGLQPGVRCRFRVAGRNVAGTGPFSSASPAVAVRP